MAGRTPLEQTFTTLPLSVPTANDVQIAPAYSINNQVIAFMICNFASNANSVFWGSHPVSTTSGIEITPGSAPMFTIEEVRELYELETPLQNIFQEQACMPSPPVIIPIIVWNPSNIWIIAATAITPVSIALFNNVYS